MPKACQPDPRRRKERQIEEERPALCTVGPEAAGLRLDHFLARQYPAFSRSFFHKLIAGALVLVDDLPVKAGFRLRLGAAVAIRFPPARPESLVPEQVDFPVLYEDEHLLAINKPPGLVVHPACGNHSGTLAHGLLFYCRELPGADVGRPGIAHRLDKDTSGLLLAAKTEYALRRLMDDFKDRRIQKSYQALLMRRPGESEGRIDAPIGRHPVNRQKMAIRENGRHAVSAWRVRECFANGWCLVEIRIETGRTHQIRVHMASIGCPVAGDMLYGGGGKLEREGLSCPARQMLHAEELVFSHPVTGENMTLRAPLWPDMQALIEALRQT